MSLTDRMLSLDRRWIFLLVGLAVTVPLFLHLEQQVQVTPESRGIVNALNALPPGARVLMACDYDPGSAAEVQPMAVAFLKHALSHRLRVVIMGLWPQGPQQADLALRDALADSAVATLQPRYGIDYINLGFQSGNEIVIQRMGSNIPAVFPRDSRGRLIAEFPIMENVRSFDAFAFVFNLSAGYPGTVEWVQFAGDRFHATIGSGTTAVSAPLYYTYFPMQVSGVLGGMKGAAEFETLTGFRGKGTAFMLSQSIAHIVVILFILLGNVAFFVGRRRKAAAPQEAAG
jgi:hypothetical protein